MYLYCIISILIHTSYTKDQYNHPVGKVIPAGVTIYISVIECEYIRRESR